MKTLIKILFLSFTALTFACTSPAPPQTEQTEEPLEEESMTEHVIDAGQTAAVLEHHLNSFGANDLEAILEDYTDESILITQDSTYVGLEQIKGLFVGLFPAFPTGESEINLDKMVINNEMAFIVWHGSSPSVEVPFATDTFIIMDGKIVRQSFAGIINPKGA